MKLKLSHLKWCVGFVAFIVVNIHVTLMFLRTYDKSHHIIDFDYGRLTEKYEKISNTASKSESLNIRLAGAWQPHDRMIADHDNSSNNVAPLLVRPVNPSTQQAGPVGTAMDLSVARTGLPAFASDESEFVFSSVIERVPDSWTLYLTTLMLCHYMLQPADIPIGITKVHPYMRDVWRRAAMRFRGTEYYPSGTRIVKEPFYCRISNTEESSEAYTVPGRFLPNRLSSDSNSNRRLDVFRCRIQDSERAYRDLARSSESAYVEILRGNLSLVNFTVSWATRRSGLLLSSPPAASRLDPWKGFNKAIIPPQSRPRQQDQSQFQSPPPPPSYGDRLHVCVPGTKQLPSKRVIPYFLEFISHHLLLGADHIYLPVTLSWTSESMAVYLTVFRSYIEEGKLSVFTQSGDGLDMISSAAGLSWHRAAMKVFQMNSCLYLAKGMAEYMAVLDIDEFFIPKGIHSNFLEVIKSTLPLLPLTPAPHHHLTEEEDKKQQKQVDILALKNAWAKKGKDNSGGNHSNSSSDSRAGWADKDGHPYCFISVASEVVSNRRTGSYVDPMHPWMGQRFEHGPEPPGERLTRRYQYNKPIHRTEYIHQSSLNGGGGCKLPWQWTSCGSSSGSSSSGSSSTNSSSRVQSKPPLLIEDQVCGNGSNPTPRRMTRGSNGAEVDFRLTHDFDETVIDGDAYGLDPQLQASIYHFLMYHEDIGASELALKNTSEYAVKYFPNVLVDLRNRGFDFLMLLKDNNLAPETVESTWSKLFHKGEIEHSENFDVSMYTPGGAAMTAAAANNNVIRKLPDNFSQRHKQDEVKLPNFATDFSEFLLGAMIERVSDSWDLYLTSFFLCHWLLEPKLGASAVSGEHISPEVESVWKRAMVHFEDTKYTNNGLRDGGPQFQCRITHKQGDKPYVVNGEFVGNKLTPDSNSNRRTDILRCKMTDTQRAYMQLAGTSAEAIVEVLKGGVSVLKYRVPWMTRQTGYMLHSMPQASLFDPWKGFNRSAPGVWTHDRLYMCVPGLETAPSKTSLPLVLEFLQHHLQLGVQHFFIGALFGWDSPHMSLLLRVLQTYIDEGALSVVSTAGDGFDGVYSTGGLSWGRDNVKNFHVNMCTYLAKGVADYVGVWDFDEHFLPLGGENKNILDVIKRMEGGQRDPPYNIPANTSAIQMYEAGWNGGPGMADGNAHPFCYLSLSSVVTLWHQGKSEYDIQRPWIGQRFGHGHEPLGHGLGFRKSIRPTRRIYQGGLHVAGACRLPPQWNGCVDGHDFCYGTKGAQTRYIRFPNGSAINFNVNHMFDEEVFDEDAKAIDPVNEAVINHLQYHRYWFTSTDGALARKSMYSERYFPRVLQALDDRGLVLPMTIPESGAKPFPDPDDQWIDIDELHKEVAAAAAGVVGENFRQAQALTTGAAAGGGGGGGAAGKDSIVKFASILSGSTPLEQVTSEGEKKNVFSSLPSLASDKSEFFIGSIIERVADSWDLWLTTFLLNHEMLFRDVNEPTGHNIRNDEETLEVWREAIAAFKQAKYVPNGQRSPETKFYCRITQRAGGISYLVEGMFVPNKLTPDINANRRLDTLRCKMRDTQTAYMELARSDEEVLVEILRNDTALIRFGVSWKTRAQSGLLSHPPGTYGRRGLKGTVASPVTSVFDPWQGFNASKPGVWVMDKVHMCVPGLDSPLNRKTIPIYLEYVQHHLLMGASHIHMSAPFSWGGVLMTTFLRLLRSFIEEGSVSVTSQAGDNIDFLYSMRGFSWNRDTSKVFQVNMCTFFLKGVADYVAIWDNDEFFIPLGNNTNMIDTIAATLPTPGVSLPVFPPSANSSRITLGASWKGGRGWASGDGHPYCYLQMNSKVIANTDSSPPSASKHLWTGDRYPQEPEPQHSKSGKQFSFKKSIIPTRNMFQMGLHMSGACKLAWSWNGCTNSSTEYCFLDNNNFQRINETLFHLDHHFDEIVNGEDTYILDKDVEAVLYHYMIYRYYHAADRDTRLDKKNDYTSKYFDRTLEALKQRQLDLHVLIPLETGAINPVDANWLAYELVYASRKSG